MKVFISWSGELSHAVAVILKDWIKCVLQASDPWISSQDIEKGSLWFDQINDALKDTTTGIVCLTKSNKEKPWILFEAGSMLKGLPTNQVCTLLIDLKPENIKPPLSNFNSTSLNKEDLLKLIGDINKQLGERKLEEGVLNKAFDVYWPSFESDYKKAIADYPEKEATVDDRPEIDILSEILNTTRSLDRRIRKIENTSPTYDISAVDELLKSKDDAVKVYIDSALAHHNDCIAQNDEDFKKFLFHTSLREPIKQKIKRTRYNTSKDEDDK